MSQEDILIEIDKCRSSPYYFATKYLVVTNHNNQSVPFTTPLTEIEFNNLYFNHLNNIDNDQN